MCLTQLLVMKKVFYMVIAFAMALAGLFMLMFVSFSSCSNEEMERFPKMFVEPDDFLLSSMYVKKDYPPSVRQIEVSGVKKVSFVSGDENVAIVNEKGSVVGIHVGKTTIKVQGDNQTVHVKVEVVPKYMNFIEPIHDFSLTKNELLSKLGDRYEIQTDPAVFYYRHGGISPTGDWYFFDRDGVLHTSYLIMGKSKMSYDELCLFMKERYEYNIIHGAYIGYINDKQFFIQLSEYDKEYYKITYTKG